MTRVNVIPVEELSDQHLIAEYRELPRCIKQEIDISDAPDKYCLGKGHMKWARKHGAYTINRFDAICKEMDYRGFNRAFGSMELLCFVNEWYPGHYTNYSPSENDIKLNRARIVEKYRMKPNWYRWTNRKKPRWLK